MSGSILCYSFSPIVTLQDILNPILVIFEQCFWHIKLKTGVGISEVIKNKIEKLTLFWISFTDWLNQYELLGYWFWLQFDFQIFWLTFDFQMLNLNLGLNVKIAINTVGK